jgi:hypothetical protein
MLLTQGFPSCIFLVPLVTSIATLDPQAFFCLAQTPNGRFGACSLWIFWLLCWLLRLSRSSYKGSHGFGIIQRLIFENSSWILAFLIFSQTLNNQTPRRATHRRKFHCHFMAGWHKT